MKFSPTPTYTSQLAPKPSDTVSESEKGAVDLVYGLLFVITRMTDFLYRCWVKSLDHDIWTKFSLSSYEAPVPPRWFTVEQKKKCNPRIVEVFCQVMENYRNAPSKNSQILCYTTFTPALEGEEFNPHCHNALSESVEQWIAGRDALELGTPFANKKEHRNTLSHDFLRAFFPLAGRVTKLSISGPLDEKGRLLLLQEIPKIESLRELTLELDKESAEVLCSALPTLLGHVTNLNFVNCAKKKEEDFKTIPEETWQALRDQNDCDIAFTNVPVPAEPHNKLTFNSVNL